MRAESAVLPIVQPGWRGDCMRYKEEEGCRGSWDQARESALCWAEPFLSDCIPPNTKGVTTETGECSILSP